MQRQTPLIYLHGIVQGLYEPAWPVFIVEDHPEALTFIVAIDDQVGASAVWLVNDPAALTARRQYVTAVVRQRLHQRGFRERVLRAYQQCCAICRLRHDELLEAAHILPDGHPLGEPVILNGLALCKLHHAAPRELSGCILDESAECLSRSLSDMSLKLDRRAIMGVMLGCRRDVRVGPGQGRCERPEARRLLRGGRVRVP